jgi:3',5'-cyclic AMP phosphodiesterase CpdA
MGLDIRFAILSDLHIGLPHTIHDHPTRFHLVEVSIPAFEQVLQDLAQQSLDFLLLPGDLTQHGEPENHRWLANRLAQLPFPTYVIPGNHDVPVPEPDGYSIGWRDFPAYYQDHGYHNTKALYYSCRLCPGLRLIALNSNQFNAQGKQIGAIDPEQLHWLEAQLAAVTDEQVLVMVHHNVLDHFPAQSTHPIGQRYILNNAIALQDILRSGGAQLIFTGHLHVQDIATRKGLYDITTGSLVSYPHPYRLAHLYQDPQGTLHCEIKSHRVKSVPGWDDLQHFSREWMGDRSEPFMMRMLTHPPLNLSLPEATAVVPSLRYFWAVIADGDPNFTLGELPPSVREHFEAYNRHQFPPGEPVVYDNHTTIILS